MRNLILLLLVSAVASAQFIQRIDSVSSLPETSDPLEKIVYQDTIYVYANGKWNKLHAKAITAIERDSVRTDTTHIYAALDAKAGLASPTFTGTVNADSVATTTGATIGGNLTVTGTVTAAAWKVPMMSMIIASGFTATNMSANEAELGTAGTRNIIYIPGYDSVRVLCGVGVAGAAASFMWVEYSTDGTNFYDLGGSANTPTAVVSNSVGLKTGAWVALASGAKNQLIYTKLLSDDGDGAADPQIRHITLNFK